MNFIEKIDKWLDESNRRVHTKWLGLEFLGLMVECTILLGIGVWPAAAVSYPTVLVTAIAIEAKDKQVGNRPDVYDIVASMIWPTVFVVVLAVIELIKCLMR